MNYLVFYVKDCSPLVRTFKNKKAAEKFAFKHQKLYTHFFSDNWVDYLIKGTILKKFSYLSRRGAK